MTVAVGGSRHLTEEAQVRNILAAIQARGWRVATGCARGIDKVVRDVAVELGLPLTVYAAGMKEGDTWQGATATRMEIRALEASGKATVIWSPTPWSAKSLRARTVALVRACDKVIMVTAPDSVGSRLALAEAARLEKWWKEYPVPPHQQSPPRAGAAP